MGLLDKLKDTFAGDEKPKSFEVTFIEPKMGMTLSAGPTGEPLVTGVIKGEAAAKGGVRASDTVVSIDGNPSPASYEELRDIIGTIGRPVVVGFYRSGSGGGAGAGVGGARGQEAGPFQRAQDAARRKMDELKGSPQPQPPPMTAEAKAERREAALKAAESRNKDWDKRLNKGREASLTKPKGANGGVNNKFEDSDNAETRRMVELAKQQEARTAASMGYNPYEARLMGNTAARAAISGSGDSGAGAPLTSSPSPPSGRRAAAGSPAPAKEQEQEEELWIGEEAALAEGFGAEVEGAIGAVLEQGPRVSLTAVTTMLKMMRNMAANSSEDKFKRIRLGNANFNSKVGSIDGGLEVMTAAGFALQTDGDDPVLQHGPCDPVPLRLRVAMRKLTQAEAMLKDGSSG
ncbi:unnamed protein product [Pylaiella littoralis]